MPNHKTVRREPVWAAMRKAAIFSRFSFVVWLGITLLVGSTVLIWSGVQFADNVRLGAGISGLAAALATLLLAIPRLQVPDTLPLEAKDRIELRDRTRATLAQILGGGLLLVGIFTAAENLQTAKESDFTDRLIRCVQLLGSENQNGKKQMDSRVGAIRALAEISSESEKQRRVVMEILAAYIQTNAEGSEGAKNDHSTRPHVDADIQAAIDILVMRNIRFDPPNGWLDLSNTRLAGADFTAGIDVSSVAPGNAGHLGKMRLVNVILDDAFFSRVNMSQAVLEYTSLRGAFLNQAILDGADLYHADLSHAHLNGASMRGTKLSEAILYEANLSGADLTGAILSQDQIDSALGNRGTKLPKGLVSPKTWVSMTP